jgi:hypothetical protein
MIIGPQSTYVRLNILDYFDEHMSVAAMGHRFNFSIPAPSETALKSALNGPTNRGRKGASPLRRCPGLI